ncbi:MAG: hypothetical protein QCI82_09300 [Candidatus Thermoplasmatota archaeon]|nr:hypothetical protein [Candidatus Thermoplasmatota archaeon]
MRCGPDRVGSTEGSDPRGSLLERSEMSLKGNVAIEVQAIS